MTLSTLGWCTVRRWGVPILGYIYDVLQLVIPVEWLYKMKSIDVGIFSATIYIVFKSNHR